MEIAGRICEEKAWQVEKMKHSLRIDIFLLNLDLTPSPRCVETKSQSRREM